MNLAFPEPDNPNSLHGGHYGWDSWGRCSELLSNAKICERWVEQWHLVSGEAEHLRSKVQMYESDISYKEDWDRSGGLWE